MKLKDNISRVYLFDFNAALILWLSMPVNMNINYYQYHIILIRITISILFPEPGLHNISKWNWVWSIAKICM